MFSKWLKLILQQYLKSVSKQMKLPVLVFSGFLMLVCVCIPLKCMCELVRRRGKTTHLATHSLNFKNDTNPETWKILK